MKLIAGQKARGPDVLQLSTCHDCLVVHLSSVRTHAHKHEIQQALHQCLKNSAVIKVGVGIDDDSIDLWRSSGKQLEIRGRVDLGGVGTSPGVTRGLANLTKAILDIDIAKSKRISRSNWAAFPLLEQKQVKYAAIDAWASAAVYSELRKRKPDLFEKIELRFIGSNGVPQMERSLQEIVDRRTQRRAAVAELKDIERQNTFDESGRGPNEEVQDQIKDLRRTIVELQRDGVVYYTPQEIGLDPY